MTQVSQPQPCPAILTSPLPAHSFVMLKELQQEGGHSGSDADEEVDDNEKHIGRAGTSNQKEAGYMMGGLPPWQPGARLSRAPLYLASPSTPRAYRHLTHSRTGRARPGMLVGEV